MDLEKLEKLNELKEKGIITEQEFEEQKKLLLSDDTTEVAVEPGEGKSIWQYFVECISKKYVAFSGRARRKEYWGYTLINYLISFVVGFVMGLGGVDLDIQNTITLILFLAFFLPGLGVWVRRLHDTGHSAWCVLWFLLPIIGWIILLVFLCTKSDMKANQYGPIPAGVQ